MRAKNLKDCTEFVAGDGTLLRELLHPSRDGIKIPYSVAYAKLAPGKESLPHALRSTEVYYILGGSGRMIIGRKSWKVRKGDIVAVSPNSAQSIKNSGKGKLEFLCIVSPPWKEEDEKTL